MRKSRELKIVLTLVQCITHVFYARDEPSLFPCSPTAAPCRVTSRMIPTPADTMAAAPVTGLYKMHVVSPR
ncbi:hypothetical protein M5U04_08365 [Xenorhabdus sp. XENO-1]|uniref:hypothetical protein n=1 Tax=Xenorhabdus bovienii TaxID=40576 RepID=UPI0020CA468E|nr:hypothetical protein [Xenorhabdus bovienii]MCP9268112.1 hypothetical protein [Xenorhabdus bovienii subsp. africana]